jgi:23S rRNA (uracil1939-C5)-methyltransferase
VSRRKKFPVIENLEIVDIADEGRSVGKTETMVVMVKGLVPGDVANVQITKKRKKYAEGSVVEMVKQSDSREQAFCSHFGICGGCKWQNLKYEKQLYFKQKMVSDNLKRIGKVDVSCIKPILRSKKTQYYRNKLEFTFSASRWLNDAEISSGQEINDRRGLGFHVPGRFDRILPVDECFLQHDLSNSIRNEVGVFTRSKNYSYYDQKNNEGFLRNLIIRNTEHGEWMVIVVFRDNNKVLIEKLLGHIRDSFPGINSLMYIINPKVNDTVHDLDVHLFSGRDHIYEQLGDLKFKIGPKSFFQTNTLQAHELYKVAGSFADLKGDEIVYDLYTGTGTIANFIAGKCRSVIGLEYVEDAILDAKENSEINGIGNTSFFAGDIKDLLTTDFFRTHGIPDVIITDPPRAGMHADVLRSILETKPDRIVYISCNPATQARDINILNDRYTLTRIQPVDMFPHTHHVENVVRLDLKQ